MTRNLRLAAGRAPREARAVCRASAGTAPARSAGTPQDAHGSASHATRARSPPLLPIDRAEASRGLQTLVHTLWRMRARIAAKRKTIRLLLSTRLAFRF